MSALLGGLVPHPGRSGAAAHQAAEGELRLKCKMFGGAGGAPVA